MKVEENDDVAKNVGSDEVKANMFCWNDNGMLAIDRLSDCCICTAQLRWRVVATRN